MKRFFLAILAVAVLSLSTAQTPLGKVTLEWDPNTEEGVLDYKVYEKLSEDVYQYRMTVTHPMVRATLVGVVPGAHTFVVTASNAQAESEKSEPASTPPIAGAVENIRKFLQ